jgi:hypothetical protein
LGSVGVEDVGEVLQADGAAGFDEDDIAEGEERGQGSEEGFGVGGGGVVRVGSVVWAAFARAVMSGVWRRKAARPAVISTSVARMAACSFVP